MNFWLGKGRRLVVLEYGEWCIWVSMPIGKDYRKNHRQGYRRVAEELQRGHRKGNRGKGKRKEGARRNVLFSRYRSTPGLAARAT